MLCFLMTSNSRFSVDNSETLQSTKYCIGILLSFRRLAEHLRMSSSLVNAEKMESGGAYISRFYFDLAAVRCFFFLIALSVSAF